MELTPGLQRLVFAVIAVALAGLGFFLVTAREHDNPPSAASSSSPVPASAADAAASVPPTTEPAPSSAPTGGSAQIYQWLPFTASDLSAAADTTTAFAKAYATWTPTETPQSYAATFQGLASTQEINQIESGFGADGAVAQRTASRQSSTGSGTIDSIIQLSASPTSITFLVTINQQVTPATSAVPSSQHWDVTVVQSGGNWQVNDLEPPNTGNQGDG